MRLPCPHCGERGNEEFVYLGSADPVRPADPNTPIQAWIDYVFLRNNPAGANRELWHHTYGCRSCIVVTRDTRTHEILDAVPARSLPSPASTTAAK